MILSKELIRAARAMMPNAQCSAIAPGGSSRKVTVADVCDSHEALRSALDAAREALREIATITEAVEDPPTHLMARIDEIVHAALTTLLEPVRM